MRVVPPSLVVGKSFKILQIFCLFLVFCAPGFSAEKMMRVVKGVLLDPGHGGEPEEAADRGGENYSSLSRAAKQGYREECYGAITESGYEEKNATLAVAKKVKKYLESQRIPVAMTRDRDTYVGLNERVATAMSSEYQDYLLVSIHFNRSSPEQRAINLSERYLAPRGFEIYVLPGSGRRSTAGKRAPSGYLTVNQTRSANRVLAEKIKDQLSDISGIRSRGIKEAWFVVLRGSPMPSVLIEAGFMSNPEEGRLIETSEYQDSLAQAIVGGIMDYKGTSVVPVRDDKKPRLPLPSVTMSKERTSASFE
jgi:N-acetylmuramoyl-L-alanine amidase